MKFLTDFADQAVMLPLAAAITLALALSGWWRGCAAWVVAVAGVLATIGVLKVLFFACFNVLGFTGIHSPSGHTASAAVIMGGALVLFLRGRVPLVVLALIPLSLAILFGITRLAVHAHSVPEVIVGGGIGLIGAATLAVLAGPRPAVPGWPAALAAAGILVGLHGLRLGAESALHSMALLNWLPLPEVCRV
jgi:hypothetical protein